MLEHNRIKITHIIDFIFLFKKEEVKMKMWAQLGTATADVEGGSTRPASVPVHKLNQRSEPPPQQPLAQSQRVRQITQAFSPA